MEEMSYNYLKTDISGADYNMNVNIDLDRQSNNVEKISNAIVHYISFLEQLGYDPRMFLQLTLQIFHINQILIDMFNEDSEVIDNVKMSIEDIMEKLGWDSENLKPLNDENEDDNVSDGNKED